MNFEREWDKWDISIPMQILKYESIREMEGTGSKTVGAEHIFLGLLNMADTPFEELFEGVNFPELIRNFMEGNELFVVRDRLSAAGIDISETRKFLREMVREKPPRKVRLKQYFQLAADKAVKNDLEIPQIKLQDMLDVILENPTDLILKACPSLRVAIFFVRCYNKFQN